VAPFTGIRWVVAGETWYSIGRRWVSDGLELLLC
jgi:hypothetical protein